MKRGSMGLSSAGRHLVVVAVVGAIALAVTGSFALGSRRASAASLLGTVGPGRTISLVDASGHKVKVISAGAYRFVIRDRSAHENFHLLGPGISRFTSMTGVSFRGKVVWNLQLSPGTYRYRSDVHPKTVRGSFRVS